jgi:hypothetical protein
MTDLAPPGDTTRSCPACGTQNDVGADTCRHCGARLSVTTGREEERGDLDVVEVSRAVGAAGWDTEFALAADLVACPSCGATFRLDHVVIHSSQRALDSTTGGTPFDVVTCACPTCGTQGHVLVPLPDDT